VCAKSDGLLCHFFAVFSDIFLSVFLSFFCMPGVRREASFGSWGQIEGCCFGIVFATCFCRFFGHFFVNFR